MAAHPSYAGQHRPPAYPTRHDPITMADNHGDTSVSAAPITTGTLVPQRHGGALRHGGTNRGGTGRPPKEVQSRSRQLYERVLDKLEDALDDESKALGINDLVSTGSMAGRYAGLGDDVGVTVTIGSLHLDALRAPRITAIAQPVTPHILSNVSGVTTSDAPPDDAA